MKIALIALLIIFSSQALSQTVVESDSVIYRVAENGIWKELSRKRYSTKLLIYDTGRVVIIQGDNSLDMKTIGITVEECIVRYDFQLNDAWFCVVLQKDFSSYATYYRSCFLREECLEFSRVYPIRKSKRNK